MPQRPLLPLLASVHREIRGQRLRLPLLWPTRNPACAAPGFAETIADGRKRKILEGPRKEFGFSRLNECEERHMKHMKTNRKTSDMIGPCQGEARNPSLLEEFHRDINGMHQEIEPRETETAFWEEMNVLRARKGRASSATRD